MRSATKGAIVSFTRGLSNQIVGSKQIRVNGTTPASFLECGLTCTYTLLAIAPGPIITPLIPATFSEDNIKGVNSTPMGRPGQPVECASAVVFLYVVSCFLPRQLRLTE